MIPEGFRLASRDELDAKLRKPAITTSDDINARTGKPERAGLFCSRVFGPVDDDECLCGKYSGPAHHGITCEKCGVDVTSSSVRSERFGRIELAVPIVHPWLAVTAAEQLGVSPEDLAAVVPLVDRLGEHESLGEAIAGEVPVLTLLPVLPPDARPLQKNGALGGTNRRYARVVEQNERLRDFRAKVTPTPILLAEEAALFLSVASLLGANRWSRDDRNKPASIASRLEHARLREAPLEEIERELLAAGLIKAP